MLLASYYVDSARVALGDKAKSLSLDALPRGPRIVKQIEDALGGRFDHYAVAIRAIAGLEAGVDKDAVERFAR